MARLAAASRAMLCSFVSSACHGSRNDVLSRAIHMHGALTAIDSMLEEPTWTERLAQMAVEILALAGVTPASAADAVH